MVRKREPSIRLSKNNGVNATIPLCPFCGKPKNMIAMLGAAGDKLAKELGRPDGDLPMYTKIPGDDEPCEECLKNNIHFVVVDRLPAPKGPRPKRVGSFLLPRAVAPDFLNPDVVDKVMERGGAIIDEKGAENLTRAFNKAVENARKEHISDSTKDE